MLTRDAPAVARKPAVSSIADARRKFSKSVVIRDAEPAERNFLFIVSSDTVDRSGDFIIPSGVDLADFAKNPAVLNSHNSGAMPIAVSTSPAVAGNSLTAVAKFPAPGVSDCSDEVAAALTAGLVRGASVGFIPVRWTFTKDPARPFGVDFQEIRLLEWSICAVPCNPDCLMIGAVDGGKSSRSRKDALDDESDWRCQGNGALPLDASDDPYDAQAAKAAVLAKCSSSDGTILAGASDHFLAFDASSPLAAKSYLFPFSRVTDAGIVAAKTGWRESFAALEKSDIPGLPVSDARSLVELARRSSRRCQNGRPAPRGARHRREGPIDRFIDERCPSADARRAYGRGAEFPPRRDGLGGKVNLHDCSSRKAAASRGWMLIRAGHSARPA